MKLSADSGWQTHARIALVLFLTLFMESRFADAIVVRHDLDEQAFVDLGRKFPATVTFHHSTTPDGLEGAGTLVGPRWILTAAHVAEHLGAGDLARLSSATYEIEAIVLHPDWRGFRRFDDMRLDIALVRLRKAVAGVVPAMVYDASDEAGMLVTFVGTGDHGTGLTGPTAYDAKMRAATNRVEKAEGSYLQFRFDAPDDPGVTPLEGISGSGDSGGPAYIERDGVVCVIGVSSAQDPSPADKQLGHYRVLEYYPRVSYYASWIRATMNTP